MGWRKYFLTFLATAVIGLGVFWLRTALVTGPLFNKLISEGYITPYGLNVIFRFFGLPILLLVATVVGYLLPKSFFLWGIAAVCLHPVVLVWVWQDFQGASQAVFDTLGIEGSRLAASVLIELLTLVTFAAVCTAAAALGAGLRLLWWWFRGESVRGRLGIASEGDGSA